jgi:hypothetical protein
VSNRLLLNLGKGLSLAILASSLRSPVRAQPTPSIDNRTAVLKLVVLDQATNKPIANRSAKISSDNGIRCIKAPCPTNSKSWQGTTNRLGVLFIPKQIIQSATTFTVRGYTATDLGRNLQQQPSGETSILLAPVSQ